MKTPSQFAEVLTPLVLAGAINACGGAPERHQPTMAELEALSKQESAARRAKVQAAVSACTKAFQPAVNACAPISDDFDKRACVGEARTTFLACITQAAEPAMDAYDASSCAPITTADQACDMAFPGEENKTIAQGCKWNVEDVSRHCMKGKVTGEENRN